ncbi:MULTISPECIES: glycogen debranching N-terminal domain-containing protein [unclassified Diaminobutyricimonas]|uniref:amylo-alpha-1,6-glucosidase n=1 Tax=unclassified Diaminobutyricimonas TaxID=2643261 RepID=UPI0012F4DB7D|nr:MULTISPECIES: glycogen debranching N-terminal domain-containing protein [unclassified Diaminobutyricimonas]
MNRVRDARVRPELIHVSSGWNVVITDVNGRIRTNPHGFFARNTRILSLERITVNGSEPLIFSTARVGAHAQLSYAQLVEGESLPRRGAYLMVERFLGEGLRTRLRVQSYSDVEHRFHVAIEVDADFADTDEADRGERRQTAPVTDRWDPASSSVTFRYEHPDLDLAAVIAVEATAAVSYEGKVLTFDLVVPPGGSAAADVLTQPVFDGVTGRAPDAGYSERGDSAAVARTALWAELATLRSTNATVAQAWQTAIGDLACLPLGEHPGPAAPAAGLPIYQQIFGRDSLTAGWQALLAGPTMLRDALLLAADRIGQRIDDWRDEEPGKVLHQGRHGPLSRLAIDPYSAYYGDWSTSPDFLIFLGQYLAWTGDLKLVRRVLPAAREALQWLERYADLDGDGFVEYETRSPQGLKNQGWKDSDSAIVDEHGISVENPIASSELQGYHYAALRYAAFAFGTAGDRAYAAELVARAATLRRRFHGAFWMPEHGSYAQALGPDKRPVRSVNSNDGQLLATGIVPSRYAPTVARRLLEPDMFSGWGMRTLSAEHPAYDPFSYHRGSVWPVESGTLSLGLARYGCLPQLHAVAEATFAAAALFEGHRLPEVISGLPRGAEHPFPGVYPNACSPQAWSASAIIAIIQAMLMLRPVVAARCILVDPHLPPWLPDFTLEGVRLGRTTFDLVVRRTRNGGARVSVPGGAIGVIHRPTFQTRHARANRVGAT